MHWRVRAVNILTPNSHEEKFMSIGSVGSASSATYTQAVQRQPEAAEAKKAGPDQDGDSDDAGNKVQSAPAPTTNANGQIIGQHINVTA